MSTILSNEAFHASRLRTEASSNLAGERQRPARPGLAYRTIASQNRECSSHAGGLPGLLHPFAAL